MGIFKWIEEQCEVEVCTSDKFIYDDMESQSGYSLPIIYKSFDNKDKFHWVDRGLLYDFLYAIDGEGKKLLDFGPGDGWPSLIVAPYAREVVGLDASQQRVEICTENAKRLGISNAVFQSYVAGEELPFDEDTFDGIMAASSIEQTPDPKKTLEELYRILKPGGKLRIRYEALKGYENGEEEDLWIAELKDKKSRIILFNRNIEEEYAVQYGITTAMSQEEVTKLLSKENTSISFANITIEFLENIKDRIIDIKKCKTVHPSGKTYIKWLKDIGFKQVISTYGGGLAAARLHEHYKDREENKNVGYVDQTIKPTVKIVTQLEAPIELNAAITAVK